MITIDDRYLGSLATSHDIGKLVAFSNNPEYVTYGILDEIDLTSDEPYTRAGDYSTWRFARRLTKQEVEDLI